MGFNAFLEKKITSSINEMLFSKNGRVLALLDESGSVTFFSYGYMPNDEAKLYIYSDNDFPNSLTAHNNLISKVHERPKTQSKKYNLSESAKTIITHFYRKRERENNASTLSESSKISDVKRTKLVAEEVNNLPYWSSVSVKQAFPYVPQLKDSVVYFPGPHFDFLRRNGRKLKEKIEYDDILPANKLYFEGIIEELEYIPDDNVKCRITLKVMIARKSTKIQFHYFFGINQPNYIVLKTAFCSNSDLKFKYNETIKIRVPPCQDENGIILEVKDEIDPAANFGGYKILW